MNNREIRILSRKSDLAQIQAKFVGLALINKFPNIKVSYLYKTTEGDIDKKSPLSEMKSTGVFTDDLRKNLIDNKCDLIVHSWKDLPIEIEKQTIISGSLKRGDERDLLLVSKNKIDKIKNSKKISILSSSPRRIYNLKYFINDYFPYDCNEINFLNIRGNIPTRIKKLLEGEGDALVVAKAAIDRLINNPFDEFKSLTSQIKNYISQCKWMILPLSINPSSPGQGALALEIKSEDKTLNEMIKNISDPVCLTCVDWERKILKKYGGGCHQKIGISCYPTFFGLVKVEKGEKESGEKFYNVSLSKERHFSNIEKNEIFPEKLSDYKFFKRKILKDAIPKINALQDHCVWISRKSALPKAASLSSSNVIWTSGIITWKNLSRRGIWVNGTSDSMGEDFYPNIDTLCSFPWVKLTHNKSPSSIIKNVLNTYELIEEDFLPNIGHKKHYYWMSSSAFKLAIAKNPSILSANHACGLGNTFKEIKKMIKDPKKLSVYLSYNHWKKSLINE